MVGNTINMIVNFLISNLLTTSDTSASKAGILPNGPAGKQSLKLLNIT